MAKPSFATEADVSARAPDLTLNAGQVGKLLADASAIIRSFAGRDWVSDDGTKLQDVPDGIDGICAMMVVRALRAPDGISQETVGNWSVSYAPAYATDRLFLTSAEKAFLSNMGGRAFSISMYGTPGFIGGN